MARQAMKGPGSLKMGGKGAKPPPAPATPFGGPASGSMPGGAMTGAMPKRGPRGMPSSAGAPPGGAPGGGGGMGGGMPFKKGGEVKKEEVKKHAKGGAVHGDEAQDRKLFHKMEKEEDRPGKREREEKKYAHGGPVIAGHGTHGMPGKEHPAGEGISRGSDHQRSAGPHGADSRVRKGHSGKAS